MFCKNYIVPGNMMAPRLNKCLASCRVLNIYLTWMSTLSSALWFNVGTKVPVSIVNFTAEHKMAEKLKRKHEMFIFHELYTIEI